MTEHDVIEMYDEWKRNHMTDQPNQPAAPEDVPPGPVPTAFAVATVANGAGDSMVLLRVSTPMGAGFYFLEPEVAIQVGNVLRTTGKAGLSPPSKLVTPPTGLTLPGSVRR